MIKDNAGSEPPQQEARFTTHLPIFLILSFDMFYMSMDVTTSACDCHSHDRFVTVTICSQTSLR